MKRRCRRNVGAMFIFARRSRRVGVVQQAGAQIEARPSAAQRQVLDRELPAEAVADTTDQKQTEPLSADRRSGPQALAITTRNFHRVEAAARIGNANHAIL